MDKCVKCLCCERDFDLEVDLPIISNGNYFCNHTCLALHIFFESPRDEEKPTHCYYCHKLLDWEENPPITDGNNNYFCNTECLFAHDPELKREEEKDSMLEAIEFATIIGKYIG